MYTTNPRGAVTVETSDSLNRPVSRRHDAEGLNLETLYSYNAAGNLETISDPRGMLTRYEYDDLNRRVFTHEDETGLNLITGYDYDRLNYPTTVVGANGMVSETEYNAFGRLVRTVHDVNGIAAETHSVYDAVGNLRAVTDNNGNTTHYGYNATNQRTQTRYADRTTVTQTYTPLGAVDTRTDQAGRTIQYHYDNLGRLTGKTFPGGSQSMTYDANGRLRTATQTMNGHTTSVAFSYDTIGSVIEFTQTVDGVSWTTSYDYDYVTGTVIITYPSGTQVAKQIDPLDRLNQIRQDGAPVAGYSYDVAAGTMTQTHGNGLTSVTETDALGRMTRISSPVADYRYGYDNVGNRTFMQRAHQLGSPADVYQYDTLSQLSQVWYDADATNPAAITAYDRLQAYTLDPLGNRLEMQENGTNTTYLPNNGTHLTNPMHRYEQVNGATLDYDLTGNLLTDGSNTYTYDIFNRQISMTNLDRTAEYVYDALGRRVAKIVDGVSTYYVYNADYQVIEERDAGNQLLARYTYGAGIDEVLSMERGSSTYTYHRDALGNVTEMTDASGALVERYEYDVYGTATIFDSMDMPLTASAIGNPYLFTGRRYDPESGNYYYRARLYSPILGRFLQMDPLGYVDGLNLYAYVGNNPLRYSDPFGYGPEDYRRNPDGSITFVGTGATIWEAVHLFEELGYSNWQEAVAQFAPVYGAADWWDEQGNWMGKPGAHLIGKTLKPKNKPTPTIIDPTPPPSCDPSSPSPPVPVPSPSPPVPVPSRPLWKELMPDAVTISLSGAGFTPWIIGGGGGVEGVYIFGKGWVIYGQGGVGGGIGGGGAVEVGPIWNLNDSSEYTRHFIEAQGALGYGAGSVFFDPTGGPLGLKGGVGLGAGGGAMYEYYFIIKDFTEDK